MQIDFEAACPVYASFRVQQVAGMFDMPVADKLARRFACEAPGLDEEWTIGAIVGPSGSGKSTVARAAYGQAVCGEEPWPAERAVIDALGERPIDLLVQALTAVGLGSAPAWIKPYCVLSRGEQFRCDLARALLVERPLTVFDEFTSVVDRTVAQIGAAAVAKAVRSGRVGRRFVAVTCHYDVLPWLEPDWVLDMATGDLTRRRLRRPPLELDVVACDRDVWARFAPHHYLSAELPQCLRCFAACWRGQAVAFGAVGRHFGASRSPIWRISRLVVLPDHQSIGLGGRWTNALAGIAAKAGGRVRITSGHPVMIAFLSRSPRWRLDRFEPHGFTPRLRRGSASQISAARRSGSWGRAVASAEYIGPAIEPDMESQT